MSNKIAAFSTSDDKYAKYCVISMLTIKKFHPNLDMFVIGRHFEPDTKKFMKKYGVKHIEINLDQYFHTAWEYPVECYYMFAGPELLKEKGYDYSLYVDGDVYCHNDPLNFNFKDLKGFAGAFTARDISAILGDDAEIAKNVFGNEKVLNEKRIQTGVVAFNNVNLSKKGFLKKMAEVYQKAIDNNIPRKGDDSLLALFRVAYPNWGYTDLGKHYNYISFAGASGKRWVKAEESMLSNVVFAHFNRAKPWKNDGIFPTYAYQYHYHQWRRFAIDTLSDHELETMFPEVNKVLQRDHVRFYWYPSRNVGDLITPYYLESVCGIKDLENYSISEKEIDTIEKYNRSKAPHKRAIRYAKKIPKVIKGLPLKTAKYSVSTGSVIRLCQEHALVYGSGIRSVDQQVHRSFVRSVRGPLTRKRFAESGYPCPPVYGDPGLLLPKYYKPKKSNKKYDLAIIPHFTEYEVMSKKYSADKNVLVINMGCGDLEHVIDQIFSAKRTLSSSLHGLVISHAYGVPTRQIEYSDKINGDGTKFLDYYMGIGLKRLPPIKAKDHKYLKPEYLNKVEYEMLEDFDTRRLEEAMFFDKDGLRKSAFYPFA